MTSIYGSDVLQINWMFRLDVRLLAECLALKIILYYIPSFRNMTWKEYLLRIVEKVIRSPLDYWIFFHKLAFCEQIHHQLTQAPYYSGVAGTPTLKKK